MERENSSEVPLADILHFPEENTSIKDIKRGMILLTTSMSGTMPHTLLFVADNVKETIDFLESGTFFEGYIAGCNLMRFEDLPESKQNFLLGKTTEE